MIRRVAGILGTVLVVSGCGGGGGGSGGSGSSGPSSPPPAPPSEPPPAVTVGQGVLLDGPREHPHMLSNPILVVNANNEAIIAYTVDVEIRAAYFDGSDWRHVTTLFAGDSVTVGTAPTIQVAMNDTGEAALVARLDSRAVPQEPGRQVIDAIGIAYFDGADWVHAEVLPGDVTMKFSGEEATDAIGMAEEGRAFLAYERHVPSPTDDHIVDGRFSILTFDSSGIQDSWDFGDERWFYDGASVSINDLDETAVLFAGTYWEDGSRVDDPFMRFDGGAWVQLPSPPAIFPFRESHFFFNNNGTAALFLEAGLFGHGFDGSQWHEFDPVPDFGRRRERGHTIRTGETEYAFVTTVEDTSTSVRYFEVYEYDLFNLQSSKVISDALTTDQPRARVFDLDNGRLYLTEHGIESWVEDGAGTLSTPERLLLTESQADSDVQVNRSGFGIVADNSLGLLEARTLRVH